MGGRRGGGGIESMVAAEMRQKSGMTIERECIYTYIYTTEINPIQFNQSMTEMQKKKKTRKGKKQAPNKNRLRTGISLK